MQKYTVYAWKQIPFLRFVLPFMTGIILHWYLQFSLLIYITALAACIFIFLVFLLLTERSRFTLGPLQGLSIQLAFLLFGGLVTYNQDIRNNPLWISKYYNDSNAVLVTLKEPLVEKTRSWKAIASIEAINKNGTWETVEGDILLYLKKDSAAPNLNYGSQIIFTKPLQAIKNSGNPGAFNYQRYCAFQDIYHQVFLKRNDFFVTKEISKSGFQQWLFDLRSSTIKMLQTYIKPEREAGVAEALLIGYRDDLDKDLVQAYSNTGVVHIIAISGLHLGMIYLMLLRIFNLFKKRRWVKWVKPVSILFVLWIFTLIAGAAPSILRSAIMFSFIVLAEVIDRKTSIYNTLAASAFVMLCISPFYLWDVGFQLSYTAVLSIVTFMKPVYNRFYIKNKLLSHIWKLNAVTLSAQVLTLPFVLYHFHQFPNLFFLSNLVAVPLSGIILYIELSILFFAWTIPFLAVWIGNACSLLLLLMNNFIEWINDIPFAVTDNIQLSIIEAILVLLLSISVSYWLLRKSKPAFYTSLVSAFIFITLSAIDSYKIERQERLVVYNIPQHTAVDIISGSRLSFVGDTSIFKDNFLTNFHIKPSRTFYQAEPSESLEGLAVIYPFMQCGSKRILYIDKPLKFQTERRIKLDAIIISKNPRIYINQLAASFDCNQYIFDASNPNWKINLWKKDCDSLHLRHHSTSEKGAFVMDL